MPSYKDPKTGLWYCQFSYEDWKGHRKHTCKRNFARKKDADAYERKFKDNTKDESITMNTLFDRYLASLKPKIALKTIRQTTYDNKESYVNNYMREYFAEAPIENIDVDIVNSWLAALAERKRIIKTPSSKRKEAQTVLSSSTIKMARSILSQVFDYAMSKHLTKDNPVKLSERPPEVDNDIRAKIWTVEQYAKFYDVLKSDEHRLLYNILFWTGARIGEVLDLRPSDFKPYKVSITKTWIERRNGECYSFPIPKNKYSIREIEIPRDLYLEVMAYIEAQYNLAPNDRIFEMSASAVRGHLDYWTKKLNLPKISPHIMRHSYASLLLKTTNDLMLVSTQLGHANIITTGKTYTHPIPGDARSGVDKLEEAARNVETIDVTD